MEPSSLGDFYKQASWLGRSLSPRLLRWRVRALFYPLGPFYWFAFILAVLLSLFLPPSFAMVRLLSLIALAVLAFIMLVELLRCIAMTRMVLPSLGYVVLSLVRQFVVAYAFFTRLLSAFSTRLSSSSSSKR
ncbi:Uncharacterised protein [Candidatus Burarchaeum australiense]|nr:Uncharacterised protein [Candidatus Burarchaeum australiense]